MPLKIITMTTLQTIKAIINGKATIVNQLFNPKNDEISYTVNGKPMTADKFWSLKPEIIN